MRRVQNALDLAMEPPRAVAPQAPPPVIFIGPVETMKVAGSDER
jgi:hypothetical protein